MSEAVTRDAQKGKMFLKTPLKRDSSTGFFPAKFWKVFGKNILKNICEQLLLI